MNKRNLIFPMVILLCGCATSSKIIDNSSSSPKKDPSSNAQVVFLFGQSNMEGNSRTEYLYKNGITTKENADKYSIEGYSDINISFYSPKNGNSSNGEFIPVKCGMGSTTEFFGPEVGMAETISKKNLYNPVYFIKYAVMGDSLEGEWRAPTNTSTRGKSSLAAINYAKDQLKVLEDKGLTPVVRAICWMQGETDARYKIWSNHYEENEALFINDMRDQFANYKPENKEIGFVDAGISSQSSWIYYETVNKAKKKNCKTLPDCTYFDTIQAQLSYELEPIEQPDCHHYDSFDMIRLGNLFGEAVAKKYLDLETI